MKKLFFATATFMTGILFAQNTAFSGKDDLRLNIGANIQNKGAGIVTTLDYGLGQSFSIGAQAGYLLGVSEINGETPGMEHRFDLKARANAHLGKVIGFPEEFDIYPGLNLGLKNFGGHVGARYFFGSGFGVYSEMQFPIARFNTDASSYRLLNNQFAFLLGVSFDLNRQ